MDEEEEEEACLVEGQGKGGMGRGEGRGAVVTCGMSGRENGCRKGREDTVEGREELRKEQM